MLRLYLYRHAKSSRDVEGLADFDRPLDERGREAAERMAEFVAGHDDVPGLIVCSSAQRTRETLAPLLLRLPGEIDVKLTRRIYEASAEDLLEGLRATGGTANTMMVIGHNPAMEDLASVLIGAGEHEAVERMREKFPTAALAAITFDAPRWDGIGPGRGKLVAFHTPKSIAGEA